MYVYNAELVIFTKPIFRKLSYCIMFNISQLGAKKEYQKLNIRINKFIFRHKNKIVCSEK